ncbi:MAG: MFS transporter [Acidimicrobiales bacterium]|jgi:EmrB/QacA subfamily drug resistance transporter
MFRLTASGSGPIARVVSRTREVMEPLPVESVDVPRSPDGEPEMAVRLTTMRRRLGLATLLLVLFLTFMDNTVISVTLANVQSTLHTGISQLQWVINGYALVFASFMLLFGTLGDQLGRKKVMLSGVVMFCAGSVVAAVAQNADTLIAGRVIMGLGAAASEPGTLSMIRHLYPEKRARAKALGIWAGVSGLALAMGPLIGGVLVGVYSFRAVFWFNLFFGLVALVGAAVILPESANSVRFRLDFAGFLLGAGALAAASFAIIQGETAGYKNVRIDILFAASLLLAVFFVFYERTVAHPILDVSFFKRSAFAGSNVVAFCTYFGTFSIFFFVALYLQDVGTSSGYGTALDFAPMAAAMILASVFAGRWVARSGPRLPMTVGCALAGIGIILTEVVLTPNSGLSTLGWTLPIAGAGFGIAIVPVTSTALSSIPADHSGMAASATNTSRELGAVAGVAILGSMVNGQLISSLVRQLDQIGIPKSFQNEVITAVTTGTFSSQARQFRGTPAITKIVHEVTQAAYVAFGHGLDAALSSAASMMLICSIVAAVTMRRARNRASVPLAVDPED